MASHNEPLRQFTVSYQQAFDKTPDPEESCALIEHYGIDLCMEVIAASHRVTNPIKSPWSWVVKVLQTREQNSRSSNGNSPSVMASPYRILIERYEWLYNEGVLSLDEYNKRVRALNGQPGEPFDRTEMDFLYGSNVAENHKNRTPSQEWLEWYADRRTKAAANGVNESQLMGQILSEQESIGSIAREEFAI